MPFLSIITSLLSCWNSTIIVTILLIYATYLIIKNCASPYSSQKNSMYSRDFYYQLCSHQKFFVVRGYQFHFLIYFKMNNISLIFTIFVLICFYHKSSATESEKCECDIFQISENSNEINLTKQSGEINGQFFIFQEQMKRKKYFGGMLQQAVGCFKCLKVSQLWSQSQSKKI